MFYSFVAADLYGLRRRVVHLDDGVVAGVERDADAGERPEPERVRRRPRSDDEAERPGRRVHVQGVLHGGAALLSAQEHHVEGRVARRRYHLLRSENTRLKSTNRGLSG